MVRAKMVLLDIFTSSYGGKSLRFTCSYDPKSVEDQSFSTAIPRGTAEFGIDNPKSIEQFEKGKTYYFDIHPVEGGT